MMMADAFSQIDFPGAFDSLTRTSFALRLLVAVFYFLLAWLGSRFLPQLIARGVLSTVRADRSRPMSERRQQTILNLVSDLTVFMLYAIAVVASLALFVDSRGLFTFLGLFSAGFGLGARPVVSDYISGIVFLFEDQYSIGDKVDLNGVEGMVENITLRTTTLRSMSGEIYFVPNGEIRIIRNFSRGVFSPASVHVRIKSNQMHQAMKVLNALVADYQQIENLSEPPRIVSEDGVIGSDVELTVLAKAVYGHGVEVRHALLEYINEHLAEAGVEIR
jgi:small conductance mechanosensitive channel